MLLHGNDFLTLSFILEMHKKGNFVYKIVENIQQITVIFLVYWTILED